MALIITMSNPGGELDMTSFALGSIMPTRVDARENLGSLAAILCRAAMAL